ncbi:hypothetical protein F4818DRAFT_423779 [Hypoxylon cercidicola]|nr:hypothetical protein F4818DRAFT_423779 [Hypoxylon cercidicola]
MYHSKTVPPTTRNKVKTNSEFLHKLAERKLRWRSVSGPRDLVEVLSAHDRQDVKHLSFGVEEHYVRETEDSHYHA